MPEIAVPSAPNPVTAFENLQNAILSIHDASPNKPYTVVLEAGTYFAGDSGLTLSRRVSLVGRGRQTTFLEGTGVTPLITTARRTRLADLTLRVESAAGQAEATALAVEGNNSVIEDLEIRVEGAADSTRGLVELGTARNVYVRGCDIQTTGRLTTTGVIARAIQFQRLYVMATNAEELNLGLWYQDLDPRKKVLWDAMVSAYGLSDDFPETVARGLLLEGQASGGLGRLALQGVRVLAENAPSSCIAVDCSRLRLNLFSNELRAAGSRRSVALRADADSVVRVTHSDLVARALDGGDGVAAEVTGNSRLSRAMTVLVGELDQDDPDED